MKIYSDKSQPCHLLRQLQGGHPTGYLPRSHKARLKAIVLQVSVVIVMLLTVSRGTRTIAPGFPAPPSIPMSIIIYEKNDSGGRIILHGKHLKMCMLSGRMQRLIYIGRRTFCLCRPYSMFCCNLTKFLLLREVCCCFWTLPNLG
jgi:hypothetical protein